MRIPHLYTINATIVGFNLFSFTVYSKSHFFSKILFDRGKVRLVTKTFYCVYVLYLFRNYLYIHIKCTYLSCFINE